MDGNYEVRSEYLNWSQCRTTAGQNVRSVLNRRIMDDTEKHEWCKQRNGVGAIIVPCSLYEAAEKQGYDMRWYVISKPIADGP